MVLNSLSFALFFLIFLGILLVLPGKARKPWLFLGNCLYYFSWERRAFLLLLLSAWMIWACGMAMERYTKKKPFLVIPVVWNVLLLLVFRYAGLLDGLFHPAGEPGLISFSRLAAPVGISFYTLRCISYMADVYRGTIPAEKSFLNVFLYVSFFPQIISGPIERPGNFFRELSAFETVPLRNFERIRRGFLLFVWGLFQKIVIAERLAVAASTVLSDFTAFGFWELLIGTAAYLLQVYCDFAGYSDMSRGISAMMGFSTMRNFRQPFLAPGIRSLWRRWHIGLTSWLTDYVYIPLGGSRKGLLRKYLNITAAFLLSRPGRTAGPQDARCVGKDHNPCGDAFFQYLFRCRRPDAGVPHRAADVHAFRPAGFMVVWTGPRQLGRSARGPGHPADRRYAA